MRYMKKLRGFTLIEVMVVVFIIGLLAALVLPNVVNAMIKTKQNKARTDFVSLSNALKMHYLDHGRYPSTDDGLEILLGDPQRENSLNTRYIERIPLDSWGRPYRYELRAHSNSFRILSLGADGVVGGTGEDADMDSDTSP